MRLVAVVLLGRPFHPVSCWHAYIQPCMVTHSTMFRVGSRWLSYVQLRSLVGAITGLCTSLITHSTLFHVGSRWFSYVQRRSLIGAITRLYTPVVTTFQPACPTTTTTTTTIINNNNFTTTISQHQRRTLPILPVNMDNCSNNNNNNNNTATMHLGSLAPVTVNEDLMS